MELLCATTLMKKELPIHTRDLFYKRRRELGAKTYVPKEPLVKSTKVKRRRILRVHADVASKVGPCGDKAKGEERSMLP